ncbi:MAG: hypothetical protein M3209_04605 [Acidobacteriota bacterium]|nr:hypothetical protein [Acidobacteriota bacterium]
MNRTKTEYTGEIIAIDENGREYRVLEFTEYHDASTFTTPNVWEEGLKELKLSDGSLINKISDTEFEVVATGIRLRVKE